MASTSVTIFNDTVLKQSVLQGYEVQRTNDNLGRFTMGELAFTRDTGRLFVGNYTGNTTTENSLDSEYVSGGILVGNKYLGFIDSKPLIHFSSSGTTGWKPLSYENDSIDEMSQVEEPALFGKKSRFRKHDGDDGNGWNKKNDFIEKYGVYSGDYTFDIYNNALILFDKNITTQPIHQPKRTFIAEDGSFKEIILDENGQTPEPGNEPLKRTPLFDNLESNNVDYPIYGDGYVIMRVLEPDGVTIGYKDRTFVHNNAPLQEVENWSHNILTIKKVPASTLTDTFTASQFNNDGKIITLQPQLPGIEALIGESLTIPSNITLQSQDKSTSLEFTFKNPISQFVESNPYTDYILTLSPEKYTTEDGEKIKYFTTVQKQYLPEFQIKLHDGLVNTVTGGTTLTISKQNSDTNLIHLGYQPIEEALSHPIGYSDPLKIGVTSDFVYSGTNSYTTEGGLNTTETYDDNYLSAAKERVKKYDTDGNVAYNLLKNPVPICWSYPSTGEEAHSFAKLNFVINPYVHCIKKEYTSAYTITDGEKVERPYENVIEGEVGQDGIPTQPIITIPSYYDTDVIVLGNNSHESGEQESNIPLIDGLSFSIINEELYEQKIKNNPNKTSILSASQLEVNSSDEETEIYQSGRQLYYTETLEDGTINKYPIHLDDNNYKIYSKEEIVGEKQNTVWYFVPDQNPTTDTPTLNGEITEEYPTPFIELCVILKDINTTSVNANNISVPSILTQNSFDVTTNENGTVVMDAKNTYSSIIELRRTMVTNDEGEADNEFTFYSSDNEYDDFSEFFQDVYIRKVEITTNSTDDNTERWETLFDKNIKYTYGINNHGLSTVVMRYDEELAQDVYECVYNSELFINKHYAPYVLKITYIMQGDLTERQRIFPLKGDITYSNIVPLYNDEINGYLYGGQKLDKVIIFSTVDKTTYTPAEFYDTYFDVTTSTIKNLEGINYIVFVTYETVGVQIPVDQPIYTSEEASQYYNWSQEVQHNETKYTVNYQGTGIYLMDDFYEHVQDESSDETENTTQIMNSKFIIKSIIKQNTGETLSTEEILELINNRIVVIPTSISIPYNSPSINTYAVKEIPTHPQGYSFSTTISQENQIIIPETASSLVLQIHHYTSSNSDVTIYSASSMDDLGNIETVIEEQQETTIIVDEPYSFPFNLTHPNNGVPTINKKSVMNDKEKVLYYSNTSDVQVIDVPLYKTTLEMSKGFSLRIANMPCGGNQDKFLIRVIGYRV